MSTRRSRLGRCPRCGGWISATRALIEYETTDGPATYAECPDCLNVVRPDPSNAGRGQSG